MTLRPPERPLDQLREPAEQSYLDAMAYPADDGVGGELVLDQHRADGLAIETIKSICHDRKQHGMIILLSVIALGLFTAASAVLAQTWFFGYPITDLREPAVAGYVTMYLFSILFMGIFAAAWGNGRTSVRADQTGIRITRGLARWQASWGQIKRLRIATAPPNEASPFQLVVVPHPGADIKQRFTEADRPLGFPEGALRCHITPKAASSFRRISAALSLDAKQRTKE